MGFIKNLLGISDTSEKPNKESDTHKYFDTLKYDGIKALNMGQTDYAINCFRHALELEDDLEICDYLSQALIRSGNPESAYSYLKRMHEAQPDNEKICLQMASVAYMTEDYDAEREMGQKTVEINPNNAHAYYLLAQSYIGKADLTVAVAMLTKAILLDEHFGAAYLLRGETLLKMGDTRGAGKDVDLLLKSNPDNEDVLLLAARVTETSGDHDKAISLYGQVIDVNPFCIAAFKERGHIRYAVGDKEGANKDLQKLLELEPKFADNLTGQYSAEGTDGPL